MHLASFRSSVIPVHTWEFGAVNVCARDSGLGNLLAMFGDAEGLILGFMILSLGKGIVGLIAFGHEHLRVPHATSHGLQLTLAALVIWT